MTVDEILEILRAKGSPTIKSVLMKHGAREPFYGVKVEDLKVLQKRIKVDHALALALYDTGVSDAMYLAGLVADDPKMTHDDLNRWVDGAYWPMLSESTVPWVASGSPAGPGAALAWIEADSERHEAAGWSTLSCLAAVRPDADLDLDGLAVLLQRVAGTIHGQKNRVRYTMNGFVIAVGGYVAPLSDAARAAAEAIGKVRVDMGGTACKVPLATDYIDKMHGRGPVKKRKTAKC